MIVSIIIPTYNSLPKLKQALKSIEMVDFPLSSFEVVIVDDGSTDGTTEFLVKHSKVTKLSIRHYYQANSGPAVARNIAIQMAKADSLLSIDSDCCVDKNIIKEYLRHFPREGLAGVGGDVLPKHSNYMSRYLRERGVWTPGIIQGEVVGLVTANAFFSKKALLAVGGFDEDFRYPGGEDSELCYRLKKEGYFFLSENKATVLHDHRTTLKGLIKTYQTYGIGVRIMADKWDEFKWAPKKVLRILLFIDALSFAVSTIKSVGLFNAAFYLVLEQFRLLSLAYGYYKTQK